MALEIQEKIIFEEVRKILQEARNKVYKATNNAMVERLIGEYRKNNSRKAKWQ